MNHIHNSTICARAHTTHVSVLDWLCEGAIRNVFVFLMYCIVSLHKYDDRLKTVTRVPSYSDYRPQQPDEKDPLPSKSLQSSFLGACGIFPQL
jgi:hypothetical protein